MSVLTTLQIKLGKTDLESIERKVDSKEAGDAFHKFINILGIIIMFIIETLFIWMFINSSDNTGRLMLYPFVICGMCGLGDFVAQLFENYTMMRNFRKSYIVAFLLYWFGILTLITKEIILEKAYSMLRITFPFWYCGIILFYKTFIKNNIKF